MLINRSVNVFNYTAAIVTDFTRNIFVLNPNNLDLMYASFTKFILYVANVKFKFDSFLFSFLSDISFLRNESLKDFRKIDHFKKSVESF